MDGETGGKMPGGSSPFAFAQGQNEKFHEKEKVSQYATGTAKATATVQTIAGALFAADE
jgi:hypothetical protein